jgi:CRISPR-associated protein, Cas5e family
MNTLFLRLEGPLQSWGLRARWGERDTTDAPTKSGVIGLLGCALGLRRDDARLRDLSDNLRMGVRVDLPGILMRDYHTTGGGRYSTMRLPADLATTTNRTLAGCFRLRSLKGASSQNQSEDRRTGDRCLRALLPG